MRKKLKLFLAGVCSGLLLVILILGSFFGSYKLGFCLLNFSDNSFQRKNSVYVKRMVTGSRISFESPEDLKIFSASESKITQDEEFATDGKRSLLIEFIAGTNYPGIFFDVMGNDCLDWSNLKTLSFDIRGDANAAVKITLKIKSGSEYPKRSFEKEFDIPQNEIVKISIDKDDITKSLDLSKISYFKIFLDTPETTYSLYLDNIELK